MATPTNVLTAVVPKLLAQGLMSLREFVVMPRLVNNAYSDIAGERGSTIDVPIPSAITAVAVDHANVAPNPGATIPSSVALPLDQWYEASFVLSDKEMLEVQSGTIPMQASSAVRALANQVDNQIIDLWAKVPFVVEAATPGTTTAFGTPFDPTTFSASDNRTKGMTDVANVMTSLTAQLAPMEDRRFVVDPIAHGNLIQMRAFQDISWSGDMSAILDGRLTHKVGFDWFQTQNLPRTHTVAAAAVVGSGDGLGAVTANTAAGATTVNITVAATETVTWKKGDIVTFSAAGAGLYSVQTDGGGAGASAFNLDIWPPLRVALTTAHTMANFATPLVGSALNVAGTTAAYKVNLAFHRDAFAFATRPLGSVVDSGLGSIISSAVDPESGLSLRLEVRREFRRTRFSYDILWGSQLIRPEFACRYQY